MCNTHRHPHPAFAVGPAAFPAQATSCFAQSKGVESTVLVAARQTSLARAEILWLQCVPRSSSFHHSSSALRCIGSTWRQGFILYLPREMPRVRSKWRDKKERSEEM